MLLTEIKPTQCFADRLTTIYKETEQLQAIATELKTKRQQLNQLFDRANSALNTIKQMMALVPQTSTEIRAALEVIFLQDKCLIPEIKSIQEVKQTSPKHPLIEVAHQFLPILKQGQAITNAIVSSRITEVLGGSDAEGSWLWKDAYEALEIAQILFLQQQGRELINQSDSSVVLGEIDCIHRLCPTQTRRSETSIQLQQFCTPLPLAYIAHVAAQITPDDLVLEPSAGTGILAAFVQVSGAQLLLNEICPKRRGILNAIFSETHLSSHNAEQIDDYLDSKWHPTVVVMNPPFSASPRMAKRNQFATLKHLNSALTRLADGGRLVAITANWFSPLSHEWRDSFIQFQRSATIVFSCPIVGNAYAKHGTTIETRLTVFDKIRANNPNEFSNCLDTTLSLADLLNAVERFVPERSALISVNLTETTAKSQLKLELGSASRSVCQRGIQGEIAFNYEETPPQVKQPKAKSKEKSAIPAPDNLNEAIALAYTTGDWKGNEREISDALYEAYEPQTILIAGANEHPSPLVQSAAMASVAPPKPTYRPHLPQRLISQGILSNAQLESVIYAGESHSQFLKGDYQVDDTLDIVSAAPAATLQAVQFRRGYFIGDSTGVGKGRQVSAILLDNYSQGRKKALWISKSDTLLEDALRDWIALGGSPDQILPLSQFRQGEPIELSEGIIFATYATLRTEAKPKNRERGLAIRFNEW